MNFIIYFGTEYVNLFSIYDSVLQENLHYYNYYVNKEKDNVDKPLPQNRKYKYKSSELKNLDDKKAWEKLLEIYQEYQTIIDKIISGTKIS